MPRNTKKKTEPAPAPVLESLKPNPIHVWSIEQWSKNPMAQRQLQVALDSLYVKMAFQTLLQLIVPNAKPEEPAPGISAEAIALRNNNRYFHRSGMTALYRMLHNLAKQADAPVDVTRTPWGALKEESE